ncbi:MAG TPA: methionine--tRNA ligase subunit beta [Ignisphaera aggregans]|uniref:Methionine--tRNA ligase n=1 Tax=Ignisphaera aggregans TaxID=334771 RepID=A0A833DU59_9CREN|nr:methionine--tRNA ligase subunit beta [Ignisphaera aggregans]
MHSEEIDIEYFRRVDLRVGYVKHAERIPGSRKLLRLVVDLGGEERQIIAGLAEWYEPTQLVGKYVVVVANLKPRKIMGYESKGMILATCDGEKPVLITVAEAVKPGSKVC